MAIAMKGLRVRPTYEDLMGVASSDGLGNIKFPNRYAKFIREGFILSQLDGEGMRQMQLQQEQAVKDTFKQHLLKQASVATGVNISDLRHPSNAETQTRRIKSMLQNTGAEDNNVNGMPTADSGIGNNNVNGMPTAYSGIGNNDVNGMPTAEAGMGDGNVNGRPISNTGFGDGNVNATHFFNIGDDVNINAATADYEPRADRHEHLTQEEQNKLKLDTSRYSRV